MRTSDWSDWIVVFGLTALVSGFVIVTVLPADATKITEAEKTEKPKTAAILLQVDDADPVSLVSGDPELVAQFVAQIQLMSDAYQWRKLKAQMAPQPDPLKIDEPVQEKPKVGPLLPPPIPSSSDEMPSDIEMKE